MSQSIVHNNHSVDDDRTDIYPDDRYGTLSAVIPTRSSMEEGISRSPLTMVFVSWMASNPTGLAIKNVLVCGSIALIIPSPMQLDNGLEDRGTNRWCCLINSSSFLSSNLVILISYG